MRPATMQLPATESVHRVAVIEDNAGLRNGMKWMLDSSPGFTCTGAFGSCEEAFAAWSDAPLQDGDVVLMDIGLPGISGVDGTRVIHSEWPGAQVIVLTVYEDKETILQAIRAGAVGYLIKSTSPPELLSAIQVVRDGGSSLSGPIAMRILEELQPQHGSPREHFSLSDREMDILHGLVDGLTYKRLAERFGISIDTVRSHIKNLYEKMHVHSRNEAVTIAIKHGLHPS